jgi:hypothetical protein
MIPRQEASKKIYFRPDDPSLVVKLVKDLD